MADIWSNKTGNNWCPQIHLVTSLAAGNADHDILNWYADYVAHGYAAYTNGRPRNWSINIDGQVRSGSYNINGQTGTFRLGSGQIRVNKQHAYRNINVSCSMVMDFTWNGSYLGTASASGTHPIGEKASYTVSYNANGGSGAPGNQTKWYGENLVLSNTRPVRTGYTFQGWSTSNDSSVEYQPGATYSSNAGVTLYAVWSVNTWTVSYNANGGSGAPGNQTKVYGQTLTLSSTRPTRSLYNFIGWGTSSSSTSASYQPGGAYTNNASITLYAIWELAWVAPRITNLQATRCDSAGTFNEEGRYAKVTFNWATDRTVSKIAIVCNGVTVNGSGSGTSGSINLVLGNNALSTENSYPVTVTITDAVGSGTMSTTVAPMNYIMDIAPNGSVAFGKPANPNFREITIDKPIRASKPTYGGQHSSNGGTNGYYKIFTVISRAAYANSGIRVPIYQRNKLPSILLFRLNNSGTSTITGINASMVLGYTNVWYKINGSSVDFYSNKTESWDKICVGQPEYDPVYMDTISFDFTSEFYTSLPSGVTSVMNIHQDELMQLKFANDFWGMTCPSGDADWIRTTKNGLIPYQSGGASALGTESWPFSNVWTNELNWTGNGIRGRVMKKLWSGTWTSGNITVPEIKYYNKFMFVIGTNTNTGGWVIDVNRRVDYPESDECENGLLVGAGGWTEKTNAFHVCYVTVRQNGTTLIPHIKETADKTPCRSYGVDLGFTYKVDQPVRIIYGVL